MTENRCLTAAGRIQAVQSPVIPVIADIIATCPVTISLGQGTVFYQPPGQAWHRVMENRNNLGAEYGRVEGEEFLHREIWKKLQDFNRIDSKHGQRLVVTAGANMGFMNALLAVAGAGDEIILPLPSYFNHDMAVTMLDCRVVGVATDASYQPDPVQIRESITRRTRAIVTISPNNPSGAVYSSETLREINSICREHGIYHISDEAYEYFTWKGLRHYSPAADPDAAGHTISLFSLSKSFAFSSWRIGYMLVPPNLFASVRKIQDTNLICPPLASQYAAAGALQCGINYCMQEIKQIDNNRQHIVSELQGIEDIITIPVADGAFYLFARLNTNLPDMDLAGRLIREFGIAVIPGQAFGAGSGCYIRIAYGALDAETLSRGTERLIAGLKSIIGK